MVNTIVEESPDSPDAIQLIDELEATVAPHYSTQRKAVMITVLRNSLKRR